jgi:hypothetical protein
MSNSVRWTCLIQNSIPLSRIICPRDPTTNGLLAKVLVCTAISANEVLAWLVVKTIFYGLLKRPGNDNQSYHEARVLVHENIGVIMQRAALDSSFRLILHTAAFLPSCWALGPPAHTRGWAFVVWWTEMPQARISQITFLYFLDIQSMRSNRLRTLLIESDEQTPGWRRTLWTYSFLSLPMQDTLFCFVHYLMYNFIYISLAFERLPTTCTIHSRFLRHCCIAGLTNDGV